MSNPLTLTDLLARMQAQGTASSTARAATVARLALVNQARNATDISECPNLADGQVYGENARNAGQPIPSANVWSAFKSLCKRHDVSLEGLRPFVDRTEGASYVALMTQEMFASFMGYADQIAAGTVTINDDGEIIPS